MINVTTLSSGKAPHAEIYESVRPRWWYAALVDCSGYSRVIDYTVHMTNIHLGFLEEFSMDRVGPIGVYIFMAGRLHGKLHKDLSGCKVWVPRLMPTAGHVEEES